MIRLRSAALRRASCVLWLWPPCSTYFCKWRKQRMTNFLFNSQLIIYRPCRLLTFDVCIMDLALQIFVSILFMEIFVSILFIEGAWDRIKSSSFIIILFYHRVSPGRNVMSTFLSEYICASLKKGKCVPKKLYKINPFIFYFPYWGMRSNSLYWLHASASSVFNDLLICWKTDFRYRNVKRYQEIERVVDIIDTFKNKKRKPIESRCKLRQSIIYLFQWPTFVRLKYYLIDVFMFHSPIALRY